MSHLCLQEDNTALVFFFVENIFDGSKLSFMSPFLVSGIARKTHRWRSLPSSLQKASIRARDNT